MMYVGGLFVDIAETSIISSFLWLVFFSERNIMFRNSISIVIFSFGLAYFKKNLLYKTEKNHYFSHLSEIFQLIVFTTVHCRNKFFTMIFNLTIYYMFSRLKCFLFLSLTLSLCNCSF